MSKIDEIRSSARSFIDSLDRSVLGRFAVDEQALYLLHLAELYNTKLDELQRQGYDHTPDMTLFQNWRSDTHRALSDLVAHDDRDAVAVELDFWWIRSDYENASASSFWGLSSQERERLLLISESPEEMHGYFAAGIWDVPFIERCRADGVDSDLASTVLAPVGN